MKLINAELLKVRDISQADIVIYKNKTGHNPKVVFIEDIIEAPEVDAVPVTRCIDCDNFDQSNAWAKICKEWSSSTNQTGYCHKSKGRVKNEQIER